MRRKLREIVSANAAALAAGARRFEQSMPRASSILPESYISNHLDELAGLNDLAQAFVAEGRLAEMENRPADAAKSYLDTIHLGNESARGGVLIDELVGIAIEAIGTSHLQNIASASRRQILPRNRRDIGNSGFPKANLGRSHATGKRLVARRTFAVWRYELDAV